MFVTYNNKSYRIDFLYGVRLNNAIINEIKARLDEYKDIPNLSEEENDPHNVKNGEKLKLVFGPVALSTHCVNNENIYTFVSISERIGKGNYSNVASDFVIRCKGDKFDKSGGKKLALAKTLRQIKDENMRIEIWKAFDENIKAKILKLHPEK